MGETTNRIDQTKTYYAYNRMQLTEKTMYVGGTYVLHKGRIVTIVKGVKVPSLRLPWLAGWSRLPTKDQHFVFQYADNIAS